MPVLNLSHVALILDEERERVGLFSFASIRCLVTYLFDEIGSFVRIGFLFDIVKSLFSLVELN